MLLTATMCSAQIETSPRIMSSRTEIARQIHDSLSTHEFLGDAGSIAYQDSDAVNIVGGNVAPDTLILPVDGAPWKNGQLTYSSGYLKLYNSGIYTFPNTSYLTLNYLTTASLIDSLDKYRTDYKWDTTAIDTSQWHEIIRDWSDGGSYSLADNAVTVAKLDTVAAGWIDVRKFGAVGDSTTDNAAAIRAALKYVHNAGGGVLFFPGGPETIYGIKDTLHVYSNTTLTSDGAWVKRLSSSTHIQMFQMSDADNITFDHFNIDGNELQENVIIGGCDNFKLTNCKIKNAGAWSVRSIADTNVVISDNMFWNCQTPIGIWSSYKARIENNVVDNRLFDGVAFGGVEAGITIVTATDMRVVGNTWYRAVDSVAATPCETVYINNASGTCSDITVADNKMYMYTAGQFGISLSGSDHGITDVIISGNYINGCRTIGAIELGGTDRCSIDNNIIVNTFGGSPDIAINGACIDLSITNNKIYDSPYSGIWGTGGVKNLVVSGNIFDGSTASYAVSLSNITNGLFTNNVIDSTYTGIAVEASDIINISDNQFNVVTGGNSVIGLNNSKRINLTNNTFNKCGGYAPIFTAGVYDINIIGNKLFKSNRFVYDGGYGIDRATISDNVIMYSTSEGNAAISLTGSSRTVITNNKLMGGDVSFVSLASASSDTVYNPVISGNVIIADSTVAERGHNAIGLTSVKGAEISNNSIYIKRGYDAWSWVPLVTIAGNSDSCVVKNNTITGDSTDVWDTTAIYLADSTADHNIISGNIIRGFSKGIDNNSNRANNVVTDNRVSNCTTSYDQAGGAIGIRSYYYNAADSSMATIIWNPTLARADTVFAKQP